VYLVDTDVISEMRKGRRSDPGVRAFFDEVIAQGAPLFLSAVSVGELQRGVGRVRHRGDLAQAHLLQAWLDGLLGDFGESILEFGFPEARVWARLCVPHPENALDKQIAATALTRDLTLVTGNVAHFSGTGARLRNPFARGH
jgi:predicted nucleic acid-binding protein